jgi:signal transduction histidine kinase
VIVSLSPRIQQTAVSIEANFQDGILLNTPAGIWAQILINLVLNSITHAFDDGKSPGRINIRLNQQRQDVVLTVDDDGVGIPEDVIDNVFEPFFTTRRNRGGTGLGLHIVYNLVTQKLLGQITAVPRNQLPKPIGCRFVISIPIR